MSAGIQALRKIIREEVESVIKRELPKIIKESLNPNITYSKNLENNVKSKIPTTLNQKQKPLTERVKFDRSSNPFASMLNDTISSMNQKDLYNIGNIDSIEITDMYQPENVNVGTINEMLNSARPSTHHEMVEIDVVPDYSQLMKKMNI
jgi:hypothetical protein